MRTWTTGEAEVVRQILGTYGIPCQVVFPVSQRLWPTGYAEVSIFVPATRRDEARALLADHRRKGLDVIRGGRGERRRRDADGADVPPPREGEGH
jgi:hypothetical protein